MNDAQDDPKFLAQLDQQVQKRNRIRPAGNAHAYAVARLQQAPSANCGQDIGTQPFVGAGRTDRSPASHKSPDSHRFLHPARHPSTTKSTLRILVEKY